MRSWWWLGLAAAAMAVLPAGGAPARGKLPARPAAPAGHWSFQLPTRPAAPRVRDAGWLRVPLDALVLAKLEARGLAPSPEADPRTLIRRVSFDLTGLPPSPEEVETFARQWSAATGRPARDAAYARVVDRLLDTPAYGERWAQHWLDVVRFAETNGFELDADRPQAWRYRDYVVRALNEDRPYDRFLTEQLAGDELDPESFERRVATGFLRAGPRHVVGGNVDPAIDRQEWLTEAVAGTGSALLGLTVGCARCHDHKFDPVSAREYYALEAFFAGAGDQDFRRVTPGQQQAYDTAVSAHRQRLKPIQDQIAAIEKPYRDRLTAGKRTRLEDPYAAALAAPAEGRTAEQKRLALEAMTMLRLSWDEVVAVLEPADRDRRAALRRKLHALELEAPEALPLAPAVTETAEKLPQTHVLIRGDAHTLGPEVQPGVPAVLEAACGPVPAVSLSPAPAPPRPTRGRRLALARWLTQPRHPLTARVLVNRVWQQYFGRGIVGTPNDFGRHGERPTHPELLDYLAVALATGDYRVPGLPLPAATARPWSLKALHRQIALSATYRQASAADSARARRDPDNRLLWRGTVRRLDAEALRDAVLAAAGTLNREAGGPPVRVPLEPEVYDTIFTEGEPDNLWPVTPDPRQHARRSLYLLHKRNVRLPMLAVFDAPDMMTSCGARATSVHALQALTLMNSEFMLSQSRALATRVVRESGGESVRGVERLFHLALGRPPRPEEAARTLAFLGAQTQLVRGRIRAGEPVARLTHMPEGLEPAAAAAWADLCLATLNRNEFVYVR